MGIYIVSDNWNAFKGILHVKVEEHKNILTIKRSAKNLRLIEHFKVNQEEAGSVAHF